MAGDFLRVECPDCENEQVVFGKAASEVVCAVCGTTLATPTGGLSTLDAEILEVVESRESHT
ncbi:30S ribosomal protein S27e [Salinarchaeum laminariae]|uniref:30S ribosomal protein S27e n=1 Tax=Salinarchaeum laminariae TaxID=869888 RepID=UPI0020C00948|nr:30S ribosomal protein S27e [Salinarchaeum laminariae]